jgi:DNA repair exonuclease SbcCD ATPase subunit
MNQLPQISEDAAKIPPFRSVTGFPVKPKQEHLPELYPEILQTLKDANAARRMLKTRMEAKKQMIVDIRAEIEKLEEDLALEAQARMQLHSLNEQLVNALREIDGFVDDASDTIANGQQAPRTRLGEIIERLKNIVKQWRAFKQRQRQRRSGTSPLLQEENDD